jgi:diguanylate cyclase (GGDEF)-like protein/PAS domain S-box-containing protein
MTGCLFFLSEQDVPAALHDAVASAWSPTQVRSDPREFERLLQVWRHHPQHERMWLLDLAPDQLGEWMDILTHWQIDDAPMLLWVSEGHAPRADRRIAWEASMWRTGISEILYGDQPDELAYLIAKCGLRARASQGMPSRLRRLRQEMETLRAGLDRIPTPIFIHDSQGVLTACNQAFVTFMCSSRELLLGTTVYDVLPFEMAYRLDEDRMQLMANGGFLATEEVFTDPQGKRREFMLHRAVFYDDEGEPAGQAGTVFDITDRRAMERQLRTLAETDELTGLLNRRSFRQQLALQIERARHRDAPIAVMLFDVDHFKQVNDSHGHAAGDAMLRHISGLIRAHLRVDDLFARFGGDEFAIALDGAGQAQAVADRLPTLVAAQPLAYGSVQLEAHISLGVAVMPARGHTVETAIQLADLVLYEAKRQGRNRAVLLDARPSDEPLPG